MGVFFRNTNANIGTLIGLGTLVVAAMALADGFVAGGGILGLAGALLWRLESGYNSPLFAFVLRVSFLGMVFLGLMFIVGT